MNKITSNFNFYTCPQDIKSIKNKICNLEKNTENYNITSNGIYIFTSNINPNNLPNCLIKLFFTECLIIKSCFYLPNSLQIYDITSDIINNLPNSIKLFSIYESENIKTKYPLKIINLELKNNLICKNINLRINNYKKLVNLKKIIYYNNGNKKELII